MAAYTYTQVNRLDEPHSYMYTKFEGLPLINVYQDARLSMISRLGAIDNGVETHDAIFSQYLVPFFEKSFSNVSPTTSARFLALMGSSKECTHERKSINSGGLDNLADMLPAFTTQKPTQTVALLQALIATQLSVPHGNVAEKVWVDRLVQRFEVTKKIYEAYLPGFRKGEGSSGAVHLYWLFALSLSLHYASTQKVKYLNTLLKVCDLLCSLPENMLFGHMAASTMVAILATELTGVEMLLEMKGG